MAEFFWAGALVDLISISLNNLLDNFRGHSRGWNIHNKGSLPQDSQIVFCHIGFSTSSSFSNCRSWSTFLSLCCSHCHLWYCLFIRPACVGEHCGGEVMEFSKLSIPFFAFKFPTWHKRSWLPAYITRPQEESHQNRLMLSSVNTITNDHKTCIEKS